MKSASTLSSYIICFANAAKTAQQIMSDGMDPMSIKEFTFRVNLSADFEITSTTDVGLTIWRLNINQKLTTSYKESYGVDIECTIIPSALLTSAGGDSA